MNSHSALYGSDARWAWSATGNGGGAGAGAVAASSSMQDDAEAAAMAAAAMVAAASAVTSAATIGISSSSSALPNNPHHHHLFHFAPAAPPPTAPVNTTILSTTTPSEFTDPTSPHLTSPHHHHHQHQQQQPRHHSLSTTSSSISTARSRMASTDEEYATFQNLSDQYQAEASGPLVSTRQSTEAITSEYANADPVYVRKTAALPQKYSHYRTVRGDGNCGWRAIAFSYFEALAQVGDRNRVLEEQTRLRSLNNLLNRAGFEVHLYEDYVDVTLELLGELAGLVPSTAAASRVEEKFNDPDVANAVIAHIRLLTSAWMKAYAGNYQPYIPDSTVDQYCAAHIEPFQTEIEHVGMTALIDALISPARMVVEILYLDRSAGSEVNKHRFEALSTTDVTGSGHYDILYPVVQVNLMPSMTAYRAIQRTPIGIMGPTGAGDFASILQHIPGLSLVGGGVDSGFETLGGGVGGVVVSRGEEEDDEEGPVSLSSPDPTMSSYGGAGGGGAIPTVAGAVVNHSHSPVSSASAQQQPPSMIPSPVLPFRHSKYQLEADLQQQQQQQQQQPSTPTQPYQTSSFKK
ncbi:MAG: hypothetical protein M1823_003150 [Watsoniomyces obsoletus]|nr:MAG: hypothetical protein M1823_003150 [Watsoniomyces obsoletus]